MKYRTSELVNSKRKMVKWQLSQNKLNSRLSSTELKFWRQNAFIFRSWALFGGRLGATHAVHLRLIGKLVVDFLFVVIERLSHVLFVLFFSHLMDGRMASGSPKLVLFIVCSVIINQQTKINTCILTVCKRLWIKQINWLSSTE